MKAIKFILKAILWIAVIVVVALLALPLWIGPVAKGVANTVVPGITGTGFHLGEFGLNPYVGTLHVGDMQLANPKDFSEKNAVELTKFDADLAVTSLFCGKKIRIESVDIDGIVVYSDATASNFRKIAEHAAEPGGRPGPVLVAGWSAGGNITAVTCQLARDRGGPEIAGQLLVCPVTDCSFDRPSYNDNATGYFLTRSLMYWFWDLYCSPADRTDPRVSPLRGKVAGLPPAFVVTCEFDPLRDEGVAYAEAMAASGVEVEQLKARGHFHSSFAMVDVVITGAPGREQMARALRRFAGLPQEVSSGEASGQVNASPRHSIEAAAS